MPQVTMPQLGEGVEQGTIGKWLKAVGDHVRIGDPLVEVVTDKVNAEVPSPFEGTLTRVLAGEGETIANDAVIAGDRGGRRRGRGVPLPLTPSPRPPRAELQRHRRLRAPPPAPPRRSRRSRRRDRLPPRPRRTSSRRSPAACRLPRSTSRPASA